MVWAKTYGGSDADHNFAFSTGGGRVDVPVRPHAFRYRKLGRYTLKLDNNGEVLWEATHGNPRGFNAEYIHDEVWGLRATQDGGAVVVAGTGDEYWSYSTCDGEECSDAWRVYVLKFDPQVPSSGKPRTAPPMATGPERTSASPTKAISWWRWTTARLAS